MSKILYPVGTPVLLKADEPNDDPLYVVEYRKGKKFPYGLSADPHGPVQGWGDGKEHKWFSVKGLKRYNPKELRSADSVDVSPTQSKVVEASPTTPVTEAPRKKCNCISREEVEAMLSSALNDVYHDMGMMIQNNRDDTMRLAEMVDHNFGTVVKKFKTLNHNDD